MGFANLIAALGEVKTQLETVRSTATQTAESVHAATQQIADQAALSSRSVSTSRQIIERHARDARGEMDALTKHTEDIVSPKLQRLMDQLESSGSAGNSGSQGLLQLIRLVLDGIRDAGQAVQSFAEVQVPFEGKLQSALGLMRELVPSIGQIQTSYRNFLKDIEGSDDEIQLIIAKLREGYASINHTLANMAEDIFAGDRALEDLIAKLSELRRGFGGSGAVTLGRRLRDLLEDRLRRRGI